MILEVEDSSGNTSTLTVSENSRLYNIFAKFKAGDKNKVTYEYTIVNYELVLTDKIRNVTVVNVEGYSNFVLKS